MKQLSVLTLISVVLLSCVKKQEEEFVILSGRVENQISDSLIIQNSFWKKNYLIKLRDNEFNDTLYISEGFYYLDDGQNSIQMFLKPGFRTELQLDSKNRKIAFSGDGINENNYLEQKKLLSDSLQKFEDNQYYGRLEENKFLSLSDSLYNVKIKLFNKYAATFSGEFTHLEENALKYQKLHKQALFETTYRLVTGNKDFKVSEGYYPALFDGIDLAAGELVKLPDYINFADSYFWQLTSEQPENDDFSDFYLTYISIVDSVVKNSELKQELAFLIGNYRLERVSELDKTYSKIKGLISDQDYLNIIERKYQVLKKIAKGTDSPSFKFKDIKGKLISLEDLKGKYVYIDIWSTACLPCMAEIPWYEKLQEEFRNDDIQFVSINVGDSKELWETTVKEKKLGGIQLHAPDSKVSFFKDYLVRGIPRFILLDENGKIIESSAKRPSDANLKKQLAELP